MAKPKKQPVELLIDKKVVDKEMVFGVLQGGNVFSYGQILQALGVPPRDIPEETALMDEVRDRQKAGEKVKYDRNTSIRINLIEILDQVTRDEIVSKAIRPKGERDRLCYFLSSERDQLIESGVIVGSQGGVDILDAALDFEARMGILRSTKGRGTERLA